MFTCGQVITINARMSFMKLYNWTVHLDCNNSSMRLPASCDLNWLNWTETTCGQTATGFTW